MPCRRPGTATAKSMTTTTTELTGSRPATPTATPVPCARRSRGAAGSGATSWSRFLLIFPTIFILVTMVFFLMRVTGDPITAALGGRLPPDQLAERIHEAGYDRPILVQYLDYLGQLLHGDFGTTISDNRPVVEVLTTYGAATLELAFYALIVAFIVGIPLGPARRLPPRQGARTPCCGSSRSSATRPRSSSSGLLLKLVFSVWLGWLPGRRPRLHRRRDPDASRCRTRPAST